MVLIRILCGKYEQEKLPDITFELVDMTSETEDAPEADAAPEADPEAEPETKPGAETAQPEKNEETEDTPDA